MNHRIICYIVAVVALIQAGLAAQSATREETIELSPFVITEAQDNG